MDVVAKEAASVLGFGFLVLFRVCAISAFLPVIGVGVAPSMVTLQSALVISMVLVPILYGNSVFESNSIEFYSQAVFTETVLGLCIGLVVRATVFVLQVCGSIVSQSISLSHMFDGGVSQDVSPIVARILLIAFSALLSLLDFHIFILDSFFTIYDIFPVGVSYDGGDLAQIVLGSYREVFASALTLSMPFLIASVLYNFCIGFVNRAMPQLMVAFVGAPVMILLGIGMLALILPVLTGEWAEGAAGWPFHLFMVIAHE